MRTLNKILMVIAALTIISYSVYIYSIHVDGRHLFIDGETYIIIGDNMYYNKNQNYDPLKLAIINSNSKFIMDYDKSIGVFLIKIE